MSTLKILHFNDVYRVTKQKVPGGVIDVTQCAAMLEKQRSRWADLPNGKKDGLLLFSGDVFSPSVESSVTRGSHMVSSDCVALHKVLKWWTIQVPVMNALSPDVAVTGNHASTRSECPSLLVYEPLLRRISTLGIPT
jgi:5'-nucleotidase